MSQWFDGVTLPAQRVKISDIYTTDNSLNQDSSKYKIQHMFYSGPSV